jgi:hypothetical protein
MLLQTSGLTIISDDQAPLVFLTWRAGVRSAAAGWSPAFSPAPASTIEAEMLR